MFNNAIKFTMRSTMRNTRNVVSMARRGLATAKPSNERYYGFNDQDLDLFQKGPYRYDNRICNEKREEILSKILDPSQQAHFQHEGWNDIREKFKNVVENRAEVNYDSYNVIHKGGSGYNYDFEAHYYHNGDLVQNTKLEFKNGSNTIKGLPCFLSLMHSNNYRRLTLDRQDYIKHYYHGKFDEVLKMYSDKSLKMYKPDYNEYRSGVKKFNAHKVDPFFGRLFQDDTALMKNEKKIYKEKNEMVKDDIDLYLKKSYTRENINFDMINDKLMTSQGDKTFVMWKDGEFHVERFENDDLMLTGDFEIENQKILFNSKSGNYISMYLMWGKRMGVLMPTWKLNFVSNSNK